MRTRFNLSRISFRLINSFFQKFPLEWLPSKTIFQIYEWRDFHQDWRAGLNVAALAFAQGMACAMIAGLPIQYGIYGAIIAPIVGGLFAGSRNTVLGPTNATAILLLSSFMTLPPEMERVTMVCLMVFLVGFFQIAGAILQLASLTRFISRSVVVGYVSAASVLIAINQFHHILGYSLRESTTFYELAVDTFKGMNQIYFPAVLVGLWTALAYSWIRSKFQVIPAAATTLVLASVFGAVLGRFGFPIKCLMAVSLGDFKFYFPEFSAAGIHAVTSSALAIAFLSMLENTFMAKSLANRTGSPVDVHQEFYGLGMANLACALTGGMVASGSVTRSGLNWKSGAATMMSGVLSGVFCLAAFGLLGRYIGYVPVSALATLVTIVALNVIDLRAIKTCYQATHSDAIVLLVTFVVALLTPLSFAIFMGVSTSVILFLRKASKPKLAEYQVDDVGILRETYNRHDRTHPEISIIHVEGDLFFGAADLFREEIGLVYKDPSIKAVIVRLKNARNLDASSVMALEELHHQLLKTGRHLLMSGVSRENYRIFKKAGFVQKMGKERIFREVHRNPSLATKAALTSARCLIEKTSSKNLLANLLLLPYESARENRDATRVATL